MLVPRKWGATVGRWFLLLALAFVLAYVTTDHSLAPQQRLALEQIRRLEGLFKVYHRTMGRYPSEQEGFTPLLQAHVLGEIPKDPWGRPYVYVRAADAICSKPCA